MPLIPELQRRNVIRVATAYVVAAWLIIQIAETTFPVFGFSDNAVRVVIIVLGICLGNNRNDIGNTNYEHDKNCVDEF